MMYPSLAIAHRAGLKRPLILAAATSRALLAAVVVLAVVASLSLPDPNAAAQAGADLTRLLRFMAVLKAGLAVGALAATAWRLAEPLSIARFSGYAGASAAMVSGPGLIWGMGHVGLGALLLHGGLAALVVLLWRDPATAARLDCLLRRR